MQLDLGDQAEATANWLTARGVDVVRVTYADVIGTERGRDVLSSRLANTLGSGLAFCRSVLSTTPHGHTIDIDGGRLDGLPDMVAVPDLATMQVLPWEPGVAHCLADLFNSDGTPALNSPRHVLRRVVERFAELDIHPIIGPELEFFLLDPDDSARSGWHRYGDATGNVYVSGLKGDPDNFLLRTLRFLSDYGIDAVAGNHEFAPGQFEITLWHSDALDAADRAFRFKAAVKEIARRDGRRATFMAKPFNGLSGSGFHLHFSALSIDGEALFDGKGAEYGLSKIAQSAIAGVLAHAPALTSMSNPTVNSYKRLGPDTMAPWLIDWGLDNRSAMVRVPPERGAGSRMEVRLGDASANPYLMIAATLAAAYLGIRDGLAAPEPLEGYGYDPAKADRLPTNLGSALDALEADGDLVELLGAPCVDVFLAYKRDELQRFENFVTEWEFDEYAYHL